MDAGEIAKIALGSGVISALLTSGVTWFKEHSKEAAARQEAERQSAIRLIGLLEMYAIAVSEQHFNNSMAFVWFGDEGAMQQVDTNFREAPKPPSDVNLGILPKEIVTTFYWLETETLLSSAYMTAVWDNVETPEDGVDRFWEISGYLAHKAMRCAEELRERYSLPQMPHFSYRHHVENLNKANKAYLDHIAQLPY